jgi:hypothetical protein
MAAIATDRAGYQIDVRAHSPATASLATYNPLAVLPKGYGTIKFPTFKRLASADRKITLRSTSDGEYLH